METTVDTSLPSDPAASGPIVEIPLVPIVERLSPLLRARMSRPADEQDVARISLGAVMEQLPRGAIRISFRQLSDGTMPGLFIGGPGVDESQVEVPLAEVLQRLRPDQFIRRQGQKSLHVPEQVPAVFASRQGGAANRSAAPAPAPKLPVAREHDDAASSRILARSVQDRPSTPSPFITPAAPVSPAPAIPAVARASTPAAPSALRPPAPAPVAVALPAPLEAAELSTDPEGIKVPLIALAKSWPDAVRKELMNSHVGAMLSLPLSLLEPAMKQGKVAFKWRQLRAWAKPTPLSSLEEHDSLLLELPLPVLIPLFLARRAPPATGRSTPAVADIPDLFPARKTQAQPVPVPSAAKLAEPPVPVEAKPPPPAVPSVAVMEPLPIRMTAPSPAPTAPERPTPAPTGVLPAEVIRRACQLTGVSGALLASGEGLVIASQLPNGINAETAAAFLPRMYGRLAEYTRELKLGEPSQLEMLAGTIPMQVFKLSNAYLAVLGKPAEPLPKSQLSVLVGQLSHRTH